MKKILKPKHLLIAVSLMLLLILAKKTKMKNYILIGLALVIGGVAGWFLHKCEPEVKYLAGKVIIEKRDTCGLDRIIADVITETSTTQTNNIKKGKPTKVESTASIEEVTKKDSTYTTTFSKKYDSGLMKMIVTATVTANSPAKAKIGLEYVLDTMVLNSMTHTVNTVVVQKDTIQILPKEIVRYLPIEDNNSKPVYFSIGASTWLDSKNVYGDFGFGIDTKRNNISLFKDPTKDFNKLEGYRLQYQRKLFRLAKNR
jgi:hypothetical protein